MILKFVSVKKYLASEGWEMDDIEDVYYGVCDELYRVRRLTFKGVCEKHQQRISTDFPSKSGIGCVCT